MGKDAIAAKETHRLEAGEVRKMEQIIHENTEIVVHVEGEIVHVEEMIIHVDEVDDLIEVLREAKSHFATRDQKRLDQKRLDRWGQAKTPTAVRPACDILQGGPDV